MGKKLYITVVPTGECGWSVPDLEMLKNVKYLSGLI